MGNLRQQTMDHYRERYRKWLETPDNLRQNWDGWYDLTSAEVKQIKQEFYSGACGKKRRLNSEEFEQ